jgi:hypothetical protein
MERRQRRVWFGLLGILLVPGLVMTAACRREPAPPAAPETAEAAPAELPAQPPAESADESVAIEPDRDEQTGLELEFGLGISPTGELRDPVLSFGRGDRVCLAAQLPAAAAGELLGVRWYDALGVERGEQSATLAGSPPAAALCLDGSEALGLGSYSIELEVSGRSAGDGRFAVADTREVPRRGGA